MYILKRNGEVIGRSFSKYYLNKKMGKQFSEAIAQNPEEKNCCYFVNEYAKVGSTIWTIGC